MKKAIMNLGAMASIYAFWGAVAICDPHLVSEEAVERHPRLRFAKEVTDSMFMGMKLCFSAPILLIEDMKTKREEGS